MSQDDLTVPPHSVEAEQAVIGGLLLVNDALDRVADLAPQDFYRTDHRLIFERTRSLIEQGMPADVVTVAEVLQSHGELDKVGGLPYLASLASNTPSAANIRSYAEIVRSKAVMRGLIRIAVELQDACRGPGVTDSETIAQRAEFELSQLIDHRGGDPKSLAATFIESLAYVDERRERGSDLAGLATGFRDLDHQTGGLEPGQLIIVAARPSIGKTALACNVADDVAIRGASVLFFTLEMTAREIGLRVLSSRTKIPMYAMRTGTQSREHWQSLGAQLGTAAGQRLFVDDMPAITVSYARAKARRIQRQHGLDLIVIDYLGLMRGQGDNRTREIGSLSRGLKALAKELRVPVIALAQLNRGVEGRTDKRPMLSDLRDSGEIEQDADIVVMLHREEVYSDAPEWQGYAELLVRKNRNGPTGDLPLSFRADRMTFSDYDGPKIRLQMARVARPRRGLE